MSTTKMADLEKTVGDYNKGLDKGKRLSWPAIQKKLALEGANETTLGHVTEAELVELTGLGKLTARALLAGWARSNQAPQGVSTAHATGGGPKIKEEELTVDELTPGEWIERYDPARPESRVARLLTARFPLGFVLWNGTAYAKTETVGYVKGLAEGRPVDPMVGGIVVTPRLPGWSPNPTTAPRNGLYPREALREAPNGKATICGVTREDYADITDDVRSFLILGATRGEIEPTNPEIARLILGRARAASKADSAFVAFRQSYQATAQRWANGERGELTIDLRQEASPGGRAPLGGSGSTPQAGAGADVVVIYNVNDNADSRIARSLLTHLTLLKRQGFTVWDHDSIPLGADVDTAYADAIRSCKVLVLGMSASLLASPIGEGLDRFVAQSQRFGFGVLPVLFGAVDLRRGARAVVGAARRGPRRCPAQPPAQGVCLGVRATRGDGRQRLRGRQRRIVHHRGGRQRPHHELPPLI